MNKQLNICIFAMNIIQFIFIWADVKFIDKWESIPEGIHFHQNSNEISVSMVRPTCTEVILRHLEVIISSIIWLFLCYLCNMLCEDKSEKWNCWFAKFSLASPDWQLGIIALTKFLNKLWLLSKKSLQCPLNDFPDH